MISLLCRYSIYNDDEYQDYFQHKLRKEAKEEEDNKQIKESGPKDGERITSDIDKKEQVMPSENVWIVRE